MTMEHETYESLHDSKCKDGKEHKIFIGMTGDMKPAFCVECGDWSNKYPVMSWACPKCKSADLKVQVTTTVRLIQEEDGNFQTVEDEDDGSHEWDGDSPMTCASCGFSAEAKEFCSIF